MNIKICDVKDVHTARLCGNLEVNMVGLHAIRRMKKKNFRPYRLVATELSRYYPNTIPVLVTKIKDPSKLAAILRKINIDHVQLYAIDEQLLTFLSNALESSQQSDLLDTINEMQTRWLDTLVSELKEIKIQTSQLVGRDVKFIIAFPVSGLDAKFIIYLIKETKEIVDYFLLDTGVKGGTGIVANSETMKLLLGETQPVNTFIAGGLNPTNIQAIMQQQGKNSFFGVDVQSGVAEKDGSRGDPKVPKLILEFISRTRYIDYEVIKHKAIRYPPKRNHLISWAVSELSASENTVRVCSIMKNTDIDSIHIDFSDGSIAPDFVKLPFPVLDLFTRYLPCINYDIHLFIRDIDQQVNIIRECLERNILLRMVYLHVLSDDKHLADRLHSVSDFCGSLDIGVGLAIQSTRFSAASLLECFRSIFNERESLQISELSLITHSKRHSFSEAFSKDKIILSCLISYSHDFSLNTLISIDRDMTFEKARALTKDSYVNQIIVGKDLNDRISLLLADKSDSVISSLIQNYINRYRRLLQNRTHGTSNNYTIA